MTDQLSLPNITPSRSGLRRVGRQLWPWSRGDLLGCDLAEQFRVLEPVACLGRLDRLLRELVVAVPIKSLTAARRIRDPIGKCERRNDVNVEQHVGESVAAEMRRQPLKSALLIGAQ